MKLCRRKKDRVGKVLYLRNIPCIEQKGKKYLSSINVKVLSETTENILCILSDPLAIKGSNLQV